MLRNMYLKAKGQEIINSQTIDQYVWELYDDGYGELSILFARTHPEIRVISHIKDDERKLIAMIAADGFVDNIEFKD